MEVILLTRANVHLQKLVPYKSLSGVFRPLKKKVSPRILATASKLVLQRSMKELEGENTQGDTLKELHAFIWGEKIKDYL